MKPIVEKVLASGLIDRSMVEYLEKLQMLPEGSADLVREDAFKNATRAHMIGLAEELAAEVEKEHRIRETSLDLASIRWPVVVDIYRPIPDGLDGVAHDVGGVIDRMGRLYFRVEDAAESWFVPGYIIRRLSKKDAAGVRSIILEKQLLYVGDEPICWQISTT